MEGTCGHENRNFEIATICFGFAIGYSVFTLLKAVDQTQAIHSRTGSIRSLYLLMVWAELIVNVVLAPLLWFWIRGDIKTSPGVLTAILIMWVIETQCLIQIIANRVALVMMNRQRARTLKITLLIALGLVNASVFVIWIPAQLHISETWVRLNDVWDRIEKGIFLLIDLILNMYFLYLVRDRLISAGFVKYRRLFNFNAIIVTISMSFDALIIGSMSMGNPYLYTMFHPVAYIVKLNIEMSMSDLILKIVKNQDAVNEFNSHTLPTVGTNTALSTDFTSPEIKASMVSSAARPGSCDATSRCTSILHDGLDDERDK